MTLSLICIYICLLLSSKYSTADLSSLYEMCLLLMHAEWVIHLLATQLFISLLIIFSSVPSVRPETYKS